MHVSITLPNYLLNEIKTRISRDYSAKASALTRYMQGRDFGSQLEISEQDWITVELPKDGGNLFVRYLKQAVAYLGEIGQIETDDFTRIKREHQQLVHQLKHGRSVRSNPLLSGAGDQVGSASQRWSANPIEVELKKADALREVMTWKILAYKKILLGIAELKGEDTPFKLDNRFEQILNVMLRIQPPEGKHKASKGKSESSNKQVSGGSSGMNRKEKIPFVFLDLSDWFTRRNHIADFIFEEDAYVRQQSPQTGRFQGGLENAIGCRVAYHLAAAFIAYAIEAYPTKDVPLIDNEKRLKYNDLWFEVYRFLRIKLVN